MFKDCFKTSIENFIDEQEFQIDAASVKRNKDSIITHETPATRMASIIMMTIHNVKQTP